MGKLFELLFVVTILCSTTFNTGVSLSKKNTVRITEVVEVQKDTTSIVEIKKNILLKSFNSFLLKLAYRESSNNWKSINQFGYMGKYQLGAMALEDIGMGYIKVEDFRLDSNTFPVELQEIAIRKYIKKNKKYLKKYIKEYKGKSIKGIYITESSIIGAAHLVGHRNVKEWLDSNGKLEKKDGNGVPVEQYLELFSGYKIV